MNKPEIFETSSGTDPSVWVERYRIIAKLNKWDPNDWIDFVQLYLGKREAIWYKKCKANFTTWEEFTKLFVTKFGPKDQSLKYVEKLKSLRQEDFESIEELEYELEEVLEKAKITEESQKTNWLLSTLTAENRVRVRDSGMESWSNIVELLSKDEQQHAGQKKTVLVEKDIIQKQTKPRIQLPHSGRPISDMTQENIGYEVMLKKMEEWSVNLLTKVDEMVENRLRESRRPRIQNFTRGPIKCFTCGQEGHKSPECPNRDKRKDSSVNYMEIKTPEIEDTELFAVNRGSKGRDSSKPYAYNGTISGRKPMQVKPVPVVHGQEVEDMKVEPAGVNVTTGNQFSTEKVAISTEGPKQRNKLIPKITEGVEPFNLTADLMNYYPHISLPQLIQAAPHLSQDMGQMVKKVRKTELNELQVKSERTTSCKVEVRVFSQKIWAIVDTGAACSVATPRLAYRWGLVAESTDGQVIVTADGKRHAPLGTIKEVPIQIGNYTFAATLTIMDRKEDILILGTDWLYRNRATIDLLKSQLSLPIGNRMLISPLYIRSVTDEDEWEEAEVYLVMAPNQLKLEEEQCQDPRIQELVADNEDLFIKDISQLTQTDVTQHRIELTTDHKSLLQLFNGKDITGRVARWAMILRTYEYTIEHCPGKKNPADALSRLPGGNEIDKPELLDIMSLDFLYYSAITNYLNTHEYPRGADDNFRMKLTNKAKKYVIRNDKLSRIIKGQVKEVLHEKNIEETIQKIHEEAHLGIENTWIKAKEKFTGEGLYETVKK
ncbi:DNA damage-inducible protein 1, partial [Zancudomyces culisetae]